MNAAAGPTPLDPHPPAPRIAAMIAASCAGPRLHARGAARDEQEGLSSIVSITLRRDARGATAKRRIGRGACAGSKVRLARPCARVRVAGQQGEAGGVALCAPRSSAAQRPAR